MERDKEGKMILKGRVGCPIQFESSRGRYVLTVEFLSVAAVEKARPKLRVFRPYAVDMASGQLALMILGGSRRVMAVLGRLARLGLVGVIAGEQVLPGDDGFGLEPEFMYHVGSRVFYPTS